METVIGNVIHHIYGEVNMEEASRYGDCAGSKNIPSWTSGDQEGRIGPRTLRTELSARYSWVLQSGHTYTLPSRTPLFDTKYEEDMELGRMDLIFGNHLAWALRPHPHFDHYREVRHNNVLT